MPATDLAGGEQEEDRGQRAALCAVGFAMHVDRRAMDFAVPAALGMTREPELEDQFVYAGAVGGCGGRVAHSAMIAGYGCPASPLGAASRVAQRDVAATFVGAACGVYRPG